MSNVLNFKIKTAPFQNTNLFLIVTNDTAVAEDVVVLYKSNDVVSDVGGNVSMDIGDVGTAGQKVLIYVTNRPTTDSDTFISLAGGVTLVAGAVVETGVELDTSSTITGLVAKPDVTKVYMVGASIWSGYIAGRGSLMSSYLSDYEGIAVSFFDNTGGGRHVDEIQAEWDAVKGAITGDGTVIVAIHPLANDYLGYSKWSLMSGAQRTALYDETAALVQSVVDNGNIPLLFTNTYINKSFPQARIESEGMLPFNENIIYPISQTLTPTQWDSTTSYPLADVYNWTHNFNHLVASDGIHYLPDGSELGRRIVCTALADFIKGRKPTTFLKAENPRAIERTPQDILVSVSGTVDTGAHFSMPYGNAFKVTGDGGDFMLASEGYKPCSLFLKPKANTLSYGSTSSVTGDKTATMENSFMKRFFGTVASSTYVELFTVTGFKPDQDIEIDVNSYSGTAENNWLGVRCQGNDAMYLSYNAKNNSGRNTGIILTKADDTGKLLVEVKKNSGSYGFFNAMSIKPL